MVTTWPTLKPGAVICTAVVVVPAVPDAAVIGPPPRIHRAGRCQAADRRAAQSASCRAPLRIAVAPV